ncbi:MDR family MFS transporter [Aspergillus clavatus NRRL 1]|uniref:MFS transporter, putative n=1 Tax=Aspergillus clavatus (strain ATCC 1007 / CBS 513.65 / DSM 816 / NCTC 3887 / NRRL 1 / QM 1276 / 107) TaxID=344612 RepID=A1CDI2_ASPCL|nr:MFS transporter, putative [Aspergillus clavatus NRRL 1]EAW11909.1 MFS transporter, putative [Aspergillus clavatus NRRL 1]
MAAEPTAPTANGNLSSSPKHGHANNTVTNGEDELMSPEEKREAAPPPAPVAVGPPKPMYPTGVKLVLVVLSLLLAMFLVALDMSIIATAIPKITREFGSLDQVGWYGSGFFLTLGAFVSFWGKAFKHGPVKWVFLGSIFVFEIGSLICGVAQNSTTLIAGRAVQGVGGAGTTSGVYLLMAISVPPPKVPTYLGLTGGIFSLASVAGPLLGGAFTDQVTWRWCFYINLPIGGLVMIIIALVYQPPAFMKPVPITLKELLLTLDLPGMALLIGSLTCFFLALEWGGITKAWNSSEVIGTLIGWILLMVIFGILEWKQGERALIVGRIMRRRTIWVCSAFIGCTNFAGFARTYNLPIYFQAIDGVSPWQSGVRVLPTILSLCKFRMRLSIAEYKIGWYQPFLIVGSMLAIIGGGLIYTFDIGTPAGKWIGYQIIAGFGLGLAIQTPVIVAQSTTAQPDMGMAMSNVLFFQFVGGSFGTSCAQAIFNNGLLESLPRLAPDVSPQLVLSTGAYNLRGVFSGDQLLGVLQAYMVGLKHAWIMSIVLWGVTLILAFCGEWINIKPKAPPAASQPSKNDSPA